MTPSPSDPRPEPVVLVLAGFTGFLVISKVPNTLHTPLMSGTNAVHGIVCSAASSCSASGSRAWFTKLLLVIAITFGTINVVGGFLVTDRMLEMFKSKPKEQVEAPEEPNVTLLAAIVPAGRELHRRPLHRRVLAVHHRPDGPDRPEDRGARQPDRRGRHGHRGDRDVPDPGDRQLGPDRRSASSIGTAIGVPAARQVRMTAMPQMVALFNGVGGGAIALIAWSEFRHTNGYSGEATYIAIFSLFSAIIGSVSFWGSNIAFAKLQEILPGRPISIGRAQQFVNLALLAVAVACAVAIVVGQRRRAAR